MIVITLLKQGIPWDVIMGATDEEIALILGINQAYQQKQDEDMERTMARAYN